MTRGFVWNRAASVADYLSPAFSNALYTRGWASEKPVTENETPEGRQRLGIAIAIGALVVAGVQAYFVATYAQELSRGGIDIVLGDMAIIAMAFLTSLALPSSPT